MARGLTAEGVDALDKALARHVERGNLPGLVALVARDDDVHVAAIGHKAFGDAEPIGRDALFRIASISKPSGNAVFVGDHSGWGLMMLVPAATAAAATAPAATARAGLPGGYGWDGGSGTTWRTDRETGLTGILLTQRMATSPDPVELVRDFWAAAYAAAGT